MKYSETFFSAQGEGAYTGIPSLWIRVHMCNLNCNGFGQVDPTDKATYKLPFETIDIKDITRVEDLPVFENGCDSSYTWSKRFAHLMKDKDYPEVVDELTELLPTKTFTHTHTNQPIHFVITGGEPMMRRSQTDILGVINEFCDRGNTPEYITIETNGTQPLKEDGIAAIERIKDCGKEWFWSVSPKLFNTSGEQNRKAIKPDVVAEYAKISNHGQLKFVVNGSDASWDELERVVGEFREAGVEWPVYIMGIGGTLEGLKVTEASIADEAIKRGYYYTTRAHVHIYGNAIGK